MCCTLAIALLFPHLHAYYYSCKNDDTITCANKRCAVPLGHWVSRYGTALGGTERRGKERKTPTDCLRATIEKHTPRTHARNVLFFRYLEGGAKTDVDWNACPYACTREHAAFRKDGGGGSTTSTSKAELWDDFVTREPRSLGKTPCLRDPL